MTTSHDALLAEADHLEAAGRVIDAIAVLTTANREHRRQVLEERLRDLRRAAVAEVAGGPSQAEWPPRMVDPFPPSITPPEITAAELDAEHLGGGILHHGCLIVRGLVPPARAALIVDHIDRAFAEYDRLPDGLPAPGEGRWFRPFDAGDRPGVHEMRRWVADHRGLYLADSPPALFDVLDILEQTGALAAVEQYLGERPAISLQKTTLRCTPATNRIASWHQDGAFLQGPVRTVNVWVALTACGGPDSDAPCLDIYPQRLHEVLESTGPPVPHAIPFETAVKLELETPRQRPRFAVGDALLFDELFAHRTAIEPTMTVDRYALESWLFAPSAFPGDYIPFLC